MAKKKIKQIARLIIKKRNRPVNKVGLDTGILVALITQDIKYDLKKPRIFIRRGISYAYQLVVNQTIGVLIYKKGFKEKESVSMVLSYLKNNNIDIIREKELNIPQRDAILNDLKRQKIREKPEESDLDILSSYKVAGIDCIITTNFKHFIELGKYLNIFIEGVFIEKVKELRKVNKMWREAFWKPRRKGR